MFSWGKLSSGQLGLRSRLEDGFVPLPSAIPALPPSADAAQEEHDDDASEDILQICAGDEHTVLVTSKGRLLTCGSNDFGQLGREGPNSCFNQVIHLSSYFIKAASAGENHTVALDEWGKVFSWGLNHRGQCGLSNETNRQPFPKIVRGLASETVIQVAAGIAHNLALTNNGKLVCWGDNSFGQLGLGTATTSACGLGPTVIECVQSLPIRGIACGGHHCVIVSTSGAVYTWGRNNRGQLGLGDLTDRHAPTQVRSLRGQRIVYAACGQEHTLCLTLDGGVFSFGAGSYGQLGHGSKNDEQLPRKIIELMGTEVTQIACGSKHSMALVSSRSRIYAFGLGGCGQLGGNTLTNILTPQIVLGPWFNASTMSSDSNPPKQLVLAIGAGGDCSFASVHSLAPEASSAGLIIDHRKPVSEIEALNENIINTMCTFSSEDVISLDFLEKLEVIFQSLACLNASFLLGGTHYNCGSKNMGVDIPMLQEQLQKIKNYCQNETIESVITDSIVKCVMPKLMQPPPDAEALRIFVTLPMFHIFAKHELFHQLHCQFAKSFISLTPVAVNIVEKWISQQSSQYLRPYVHHLKKVAVHIIHEKIKVKIPSAFLNELEVILILMRCLNRINVTNKCIIDYEDFYIPEVKDAFNLQESYLKWLLNRQTQTGDFYICNYPFVFDSLAKTTLLEIDQTVQMEMATSQAMTSATMMALIAPNIGMVLNGNQVPYLFIEVRRDNIVEDSLTQLRMANPADLKKPMKVKFSGEEAEDAGGVRKEFFLLLLREILDPKYGMFKTYEETNAMWFSSNSFEDEHNYFLIGILCGLAIYNFTIINIPFPLVLYKKLLEELGTDTIDDIYELSPLVANGLKQLRDYSEPDIADVFCLTFVVHEEYFGQVLSVPLKENGENILVNQENKMEYITLYCDYILNKSVAKQFKAFHGGFHKVCGGRVLDLFHARELQALIAGTESYNWKELEDSTVYKNGYSSDDLVIQNFWTVFHNELTEQDRKKFLKFVSGTDRVPIQGMKGIHLKIQKTNDVNYLPVAHTCFNLLDLPSYATKEKLKYKLMQAIQCTEGFGLV